MVDAWGKPPEGIFQGRFLWPGSMDECEKVKGDRIRVVNASTGEVEVVLKGGVKGAWSMANLEIPTPAGLPGAELFGVSFKIHCSNLQQL